MSPTVKLTTGAGFIYREGQERYIPIKFSVRGRDLGTTVLEARQKVEEAVPIPAATTWNGLASSATCRRRSPGCRSWCLLAVALICLLLFVHFGSVADMLLAASVIPMSTIGGILALWITGTPFSVSAAIGFVALFGISAMDGIIVMSFFNNAIVAGDDRAAAILRTCRTQMRPVLMTCVVACVGLLPAAISTGIGAQVQRPLAIVVVGGTFDGTGAAA